MVRRIVLDLSAKQREALNNTLQRLSRSPEKPEIVAAEDVEVGDGDLFITEDQDHAMAAAQKGATVWRVQPGFGELNQWEDLPLSMAFLNGTLDELRQVLTERPELQGHKISSLSWTSQGYASGSTDDGNPIFVTAGPDGETPQIFLGPEAEARQAEAQRFAQTLMANEQVSKTGNLGPGQTHTLTDGQGRRPILKRGRFYLR
jgi:hypothetical protein